jgi:ABC-type iron transport system FetAB permease component
VQTLKRFQARRDLTEDQHKAAALTWLPARRMSAKVNRVVLTMRRPLPFPPREPTSIARVVAGHARVAAPRAADGTNRVEPGPPEKLAGKNWKIILEKWSASGSGSYAEK